MNKTTAIRVSVNRKLNYSEVEWIKSLVRLDDSHSLVYSAWDGEKNGYLIYPFVVRLSERGKFWIHSNSVESRRLFEMFCLFLEDNFVNIHAVAVKTFSSVPASKDTGGVSMGPLEWEVIGLVDA